MIRWCDLTNEEIDNVERKIPVIIPIGLIEAHGPHMPLGFDNESANYFAEKIADLANCILMPSINYGFADSNKEYPGTIGLSAITLIRVIVDICEMLCFHGFNKIIILSGHGANKMPCEMAFYEIWEKYRDLKAVYWNWWSEANIEGVHHADKKETEVGLAIGSKINMSKAENFKAEKYWYKEISRFTKNPKSGGINGKPVEADLKEGILIRDQVIKILSEKVNEISKQ